MHARLFCCLAVVLLLCVATQAHAEDEGFNAIFNGRDLTGWDRNPKFWSVRDGVIRGETTLSNLTFSNTFCIWRGGTLKDFELRIKFRLQSGNSGIQYRSKDLGKWAVSGYQAEIENTQGKVGFLYEEKGRKFLANVGEKVATDSAGKIKIIGQLASKEDYIRRRYYKDQDWNEYRIVARGSYITHFLNGFQTIELTDNDRKARSLEGVLALQIHAGPPMLVEFKDVLLKKL